MSSQRIHQLQISFSPEQDRLQLKINTQDRSEFSFWLTRRFIMRFWPGLKRTLEVNPGSEIPKTSNPAARTAMLDFMHQHAVSQANFSTDFQDNPTNTPLGGEPVLVTKARIEPQEGGNYLVSLHPEKGYGIEVAMDTNLLHSLCKLLNDASNKADWNLGLSILPSQTKNEALFLAAPNATGSKLN